MKTKKWLLAIMVCAALCVWFTGCDTAASEDADDVVASYSETRDGTTATWYFYTNGNFSCASHNGTTSCITLKGTYTGNPAIDGDIMEVMTHTWSEKSKTLVTAQKYCEEEERPYNSKDWEYVTTVLGGSFTVGTAPNSTTFTRD